MGSIFNIYTNGSGEIISGRITSGGMPLSNATVTAYRVGGGIYILQPRIQTEFMLWFVFHLRLNTKLRLMPFLYYISPFHKLFDWHIN